MLLRYIDQGHGPLLSRLATETGARKHPPQQKPNKLATVANISPLGPSTGSLIQTMCSPFPEGVIIRCFDCGSGTSQDEDANPTYVASEAVLFWPGSVDDDRGTRDGIHAMSFFGE